jgi:hypothetical protein
MNEQELRAAMRATMATATAPPPMSETPVLDAARRDERRRKARWAGVGSAVAAAAVVALAVVVVATTSGAGGTSPVGAGSPTSSATGTSSQDPSGSATNTETSNTEPDWPDGQTDATATAGPHYDTGVALLESMATVVPAGFEAPRGLEFPGGGAGLLDMSQAAWDGKSAGVDVWDYYATLPLTKGTRMGELIVDVKTPGNEATGTGCDLGNLWGWEGTCVARTVGGEPVGLWTGTEAQPGRAASFRHDDGTVVWVFQSPEYFGSGRPALSDLPYSDQQLLELATDEKFHLG